MSKERFKQMQDTYAQAMSKFGLVRGKEGSEARHISTQQYYRKLVDRNEELKEDIEYLEERKQEVQELKQSAKSCIRPVPKLEANRGEGFKR